MKVNKKKFTLDKVYKKRFFSRSVKYDFYTDNLMKLANKQCADYIVEIPDNTDDTEEN